MVESLLKIHLTSITTNYQKCNTDIRKNLDFFGVGIMKRNRQYTKDYKYLQSQPSTKAASLQSVYQRSKIVLFFFWVHQTKTTSWENLSIYTSIHPKLGGKKSNQSFIFMSLLLKRQLPILLFDAKTFPAASNEHFFFFFIPTITFLTDH